MHVVVPVGIDQGRAAGKTRKIVTLDPNEHVLGMRRARAPRSSVVSGNEQNVTELIGLAPVGQHGLDGGVWLLAPAVCVQQRRPISEALEVAQIFADRHVRYPGEHLVFQLGGDDRAIALDDAGRTSHHAPFSALDVHFEEVHSAGDELVEAEGRHDNTRMSQEVAGVDEATVGSHMRRVVRPARGHIGRHRKELDVRAAVESERRQQQPAILRVRLECDHPTRSADQARGQEGVVPEVGSDVDHGHSGSAVALEHHREMWFVDARAQTGCHGSVSGIAEQLDPADRTVLGIDLGQLHHEGGRCELVLNRPEHLSDGGDLGQITRAGCVDGPTEVLGQGGVDQMHQLLVGEPSLGKGATKPLDEAIAPRWACRRHRVAVVVGLIHARPHGTRAPAQAGVLPADESPEWTSSILGELQLRSLSEDGRRHRGRPVRAVSPIVTPSGEPAGKGPHGCSAQADQSDPSLGGGLGAAAVLVAASVVGVLAPAALAPSTASAVTTPQVSGGGNYTCALLPSGSVDCWGVNPWGQLGNGTTSDSDVPVQVTPLPPASAVTAGTGHTCALDTSGNAFCWGTDSSGELGNGKNNNKLAPVPVSGGLEFSQIAAGGFATSGAFPTADYTCGVAKAGPASGPGQIWCWGYNGYGQLGNSTTTSSNVPVAVTGLPASAVQVATGPGHACAALTDGSVWCWGLNNDGQLGNNATKNKKNPVQAIGVGGAVAVGAGTYHSCALLASGGVMCWGNNASGQLGNGTTNTSDVPVPVNPLAGTVQQIALGGDHTCALIGNPQTEVECWGDDQRGDVGDGNMQEPPVTSPEPVFGLAGSAATGQGVVPTAIGAGNAHSCSFVLTGQLYCWGANIKGEVGDGTTEDRDVPTLVLGITPGVQQISEGSGGGCALTSGLGVKCWGGFDGNDFVEQTSAEAVATLPGGVAEVSAGDIDACAVSTSGSLQCWGGNELGEVGNGTTDPQATPVGVSGLSSGVGYVSEGDMVTCATKGKEGQPVLLGCQ